VGPAHHHSGIGPTRGVHLLPAGQHRTCDIRPAVHPVLPRLCARGHALPRKEVAGPDREDRPLVRHQHRRGAAHRLRPQLHAVRHTPDTDTNLPGHLQRGLRHRRHMEEGEGQGPLPSVRAPGQVRPGEEQLPPRV